MIWTTQQRMELFDRAWRGQDYCPTCSRKLVHQYERFFGNGFAYALGISCPAGCDRFVVHGPDGDFAKANFHPFTLPEQLEIARQHITDPATPCPCPVCNIPLELHTVHKGLVMGRCLRCCQAVNIEV